MCLANSAWARIFILLFTGWFWTYWFSNYVILDHYLYDTTVSDFNIFYTAGQAWLSGMNPYTNSTHPGFIYPPTSLPFYGSFAFLNWGPAAQLWTGLYLSLFFVATLALAITLEGERRFMLVAIAMMLFLTSYPLIIMMELSQSDLLIASLTVLSLVLVRTRHEFASATLLSAAVLLKGSAIFLLIYFVVFRRDLRFLRKFLLSTLALVGTSLVAVPLYLYAYYFANVLPAQFGGYQLESSQTIIRVLYLAGVSKELLEIIAIAGIGAFAVCAFHLGASKSGRSLRLNTIRDDAMFLMNGLIILLLNPKAIIYPYVWVILPLALFLTSILIEDVRLVYLALIGFATCFLNTAEETAVLALFIYPMTLPTILIGNIAMIATLILVYLCPKTIFRGPNRMQWEHSKTRRIL